MTNLNNGPSETSDYACCIKELAESEEAIIDLDLENVRQRMKFEDELEFVYGLLEDAYAEIKQLRAKHSSGRQSKKKVLEKVGQPEPNTTLHVPDPLNVKDTKYGFTEDKDKSFDVDSAKL